MSKLLFNKNHFPDLNLILEYFGGDMTLGNYTHCSTSIAKDPIFTLECNTLSDIRELTVTGLTSHINEFVQFSAKGGVVEINKKSALLVSNANQQVYGQLYANLCEEHNLDVEIFFDLKTALEWLEGSTDTVRVELELQKLKEEPQIFQGK